MVKPLIFNFRMLLIAVIVLMLSAVAVLPAYAQGNNSPVITLRMRDDMGYGKFVKPISGNGTITVDKDGNVTSNSSSIQILSSANSSGAESDVIIRRGSGNTFNASFSSVDNVPGLEFISFFGSYACLQRCNFNGNFNLLNNQTISFPINTNQRVRIRTNYGAVMRVSSAVVTGALNPQYNFVVDFE